VSGTASEPKWLWAWSGESFGYREGDDLWTHDGRHVGRFDADEIYSPDGRYLGEVLDGNRLITAKFRLKTHRTAFAAQSRRPRLPRRNLLPGYRVPSGHEDFPLPEKLP
jgi:hypothetical protein